MCSSGFSFCGWFVWVQRMFPIQPIGRLSVAVVAQDVGNDMAVDIATLMGIDGATVASGNCLLYKGCFGLGGFKICIFRGWIFSTMVGSHLLGLEVGPSYLSSVLVDARVIMARPKMILTTESPLPADPKLRRFPKKMLRHPFHCLNMFRQKAGGFDMHIQTVDSKIYLRVFHVCPSVVSIAVDVSKDADLEPRFDPGAKPVTQGRAKSWAVRYLEPITPF